MVVPTSVSPTTGTHAQAGGIRNALFIWVLIDLLLFFVCSNLAAFLIERDLGETQWLMIGLMSAVRLILFIQSGMYRAVLRYSGLHTAFTAGGSILAGTCAIVIVAYFLRLPNTGGLGRVFLSLEVLMTIICYGGTRMAARAFLQRKDRRGTKRVLIYGASELGEIALRDLDRHPDFHPIGFIDDNPNRIGQLIHGRKVLGNVDSLAKTAAALKPDLLVVAVSQLPQDQLRSIFNRAMKLGMQVKVVKGLADSIRGPATANLQDIALEDLLSRPIRNHDRSKLERMLRGKTVLVTGAGGSIGSELCRQISSLNPSGLILLDHSEFNLYQIDSELHRRFPALPISSVLNNLSDTSSLRAIFEDAHPEVVFHAAAYKHVPLVEENPFLGMANNLGGFSNLLECAVLHGVERFITISTDKAVRPTNIMGASKRACEVLLQSYDTGKTQVCAVRFGNVLGSSGSVIPLFLEQIRKGGPVTVTHPEVTRYFMLIPEAVELVLQAGAMAEHQEIFILDMGEPVKIVDLARHLIFITGSVPDKDIAISFTGLRPGEKLYEELLLGESEAGTCVNGITIAKPTKRDVREVMNLVNGMLHSCDTRNMKAFISHLSQLVPEWVPSDQFIESMDQNKDASSSVDLTLDQAERKGI
jgi:FlaA1/EpsC-like NDP-sugar epimerase